MLFTACALGKLKKMINELKREISCTPDICLEILFQGLVAKD